MGTQSSASWWKRFLIIWLVIAVLAIGYYFLGVKLGYFGQYAPGYEPAKISAAVKLTKAFWPIFGASILLAAVSTFIWRSGSGHGVATLKGGLK